MKIFLLLLLAYAVVQCKSVNKDRQLPEPVTNNAVVALQKNGRPVIYSFFGLNSAKNQRGVHNKTFKVDVATGKSSSVRAVPDEFGRLASSASVIRNRAYIAGGYAVMPNGKERSSNNIYCFNPDDESFTEGASMPIVIDDHVQGVWRDSLLYVVSGWSDSLNVNVVQIYNPLNDSWKLATSLPDEPGAKKFGGCGLIAGDTIYVLGGATFARFYPPSHSFYKGAINPQDATKIRWIKGNDYPGEFRYRSVAFHGGGIICFFGGSNETYNYNGISYAEKKPVEPNATMLLYNIALGTFEIKSSSIRLMDLRNAAIINSNFYIAGGMRTHQQVSKEIIKINFP